MLCLCRNWKRLIECYFMSVERLQRDCLAYVGNNSVAHGMFKISSRGRLSFGSHPKASVQGTSTWSILTLPDSVSRRPMLSQLCCQNVSRRTIFAERNLTANWMPGCRVSTNAKMWESVPSYTPSSTVRSDTTPPVLKFLKPYRGQKTANLMRWTYREDEIVAL